VCVCLFVCVCLYVCVWGVCVREFRTWSIRRAKSRNFIRVIYIYI